MQTMIYLIYEKFPSVHVIESTGFYSTTVCDMVKDARWNFESCLANRLKEDRKSFFAFVRSNYGAPEMISVDSVLTVCSNK